VACFLKGAAGTCKEWLRMSSFDRAVICDEVQYRIEEHNAQFDE
jgi:hypothetical protein